MSEYTNKLVQADKKLVPYEFVSDNDKPAMEVIVGGETQKFASEEVSAMILGKMKTDFDQRVMQFFIKMMKKKSNTDISGDKRALQKLRKEVERVKRALSTQQQARLEIEDLAEGFDLSETLTHDRFEELNNNLFKKILGPAGHANGIFQVSAEDKGTGKAEKITITAEKGRLSEDEIERMVKEAEEFADEDKKVKDRIDSRNGLESYVYNLKNQLDDEEKGMADKISAEDKKDLQDSIDETLDWLDENPEADKEDYDEKQKEVENIANPIMRKMYSGGEGGAEEEGGSNKD